MYKNKCSCCDDVIWLMAIKTRLKMKNRLEIHDINRPGPRHGHKYTKHKMYFNVIMVNKT